MKITLSDKLIAWLALLSGLSISAVAIYYSVAGLVSIFAAAVIPIIVMGVVLEVGKLSATVWLKQNWSVAPRFLKAYLLIAITVLMLITSMGIFGYLSKAHLDQAVPTGDVADKVAFIDEKIKTQKENIDAARKALKQMDEAVDQTMARSTSEQGADKAAGIRRAQQRERSNLQGDISKAQSTIAKLNEERAPIAKELRKVEAEVGPIKYIAALIYGDTTDSNLLEAAVRWVIIVIVLVFDPLAVILLLASQYSFAWFRKAKDETVENIVKNDIVESPTVEEPAVDTHPADRLLRPDPSPPGWMYNTTTTTYPSTEEEVEELIDASIIDNHPYLKQPFKHFENLKPMVHKAEGDSPQGPVNVVDSQPTVTDHDDEHELAIAPDNEKIAMARWKYDNPDSSLKLQRKLLENGAITELPWMQYLKLKADYTDSAVEESKKKDSDVVGEGRNTSGQENQGSVEYVQNAEQTKSTLWQRVKAKKDDQ
jgi:hypothetical protein